MNRGPLVPQTSALTRLRHAPWGTRLAPTQQSRALATGPFWHGSAMPTDQYHEPPADLSNETRTFARVIASLQEEAEAIGWYEQRMSVETNDEARRIMEHAQREEFLHFSMDLAFLIRRKEKWHVALEKILFKDGDIVELAEQAEDAVED